MPPAVAHEADTEVRTLDSPTVSSGSQTPDSVSSNTTNSAISSKGSDLASRRKIDFSILAETFAPASNEGSTPPSLWYILTTGLLLAFHKEKLIGRLWEYLSRNHDAREEDLLATARRIREACLKCSTLVGFPRAINALLTLQRAIESSHTHLSATFAIDESLRGSPSLSASQKHDRGMSLFEKIYAKHTPRVMASMTSCSGGDLTHFAINCIYGELLAENSIIGDLETGILEFVCCLADGCGPQAKGHFFGSVNLGAGKEALRKAVELTETIAKQVGVPCLWLEKDDDEEGKQDWKFLDKVMVD